MTWRRAVFLVFLVWMSAPAQSAELSRRDCHIGGVETPLSCVSLEVPLDWSAPNGRTIEITAVVAPAMTGAPAADPLLVLAGGPGQAASDMGPWLASAFKDTRRTRDIILFDTRGTGLSGALDCGIDMSLKATGTERLAADAKACAAHLGPDLRFYTTREIVEDMEAFRRAAGIAKLNLWGGSYGTRIAQHYIRKYGAHVKSAVLDAATPLGVSIFESGPVDGQAAFDRIARECSADPACAALAPDLPARFDALLNRVAERPAIVDLDDPRSGARMHVAVDRDAIAGGVRGALYAGTTREMVPFAIMRADAGDMRPLAALIAATSSWSAETQAMGQMFSILCAEDVRQSAKAPPASVSVGFMQDVYYRSFAAVCRDWPAGNVPMEAMAKSPVPALVISGEADPVTPPRLGAIALAQFVTGVHAIVPHGTHTNSSRPCVAKLIAEFIADPQTGARNQACLKRIAPPRFVVSATAAPG